MLSRGHLSKRWLSILTNSYRCFFIVLALAVLFTASWTNVNCVRSGDSTVVVFAASSLRESFLEIGSLYQQSHPGMKLNFNFASSSMLQTQIANGAKADIYASANSERMEMVVKQGLIHGEPRIFANSELVVIIPVGADNIREFHELNDPGLKLIIGQPGVPVGDYALEIIANASNHIDFGKVFSAAVLSNIVSSELNVKQIVAKVVLGEVDAGFVYATDVTQSVDSNVRIVPIPDHLNVTARYYIGMLKASSALESAIGFAELIESPVGKEILRRYGFQVR